MTREAMAKADQRNAQPSTTFSDGYIRLVVTRGAGTLGLDPNRTSNPQVIIIADKIALYPEEFYEQGAGDHHGQHDPQPSGGAQPADQVAQLPEQHPGQDRGAAGRLHRSPDAQPQGRSRRMHGRQHLPGPPQRAAHALRSTPGILEGITREAVIELARAAGREVRESPLTKHDVYIADECFLTGTAAEVIPVVKVDSRRIGNGAARPGHPRPERAVSRARPGVEHAVAGGGAWGSSEAMPQVSPYLW